MREAQEGRVEWPDVEEGTFLRFMEWAYTENYPVAEPDILLAHSDLITTPGASPLSAEAQANCDELPLSGLSTTHSEIIAAKLVKVRMNPVSSCCGSPITPTGVSKKCNKCSGISASGLGICQQCRRSASTCAECQNGRTTCPTCKGVSQCELTTGRCKQCSKHFTRSYCDTCRTAFPQQCLDCSVKAGAVKGTGSKYDLVKRFVDEGDATYPSPTTKFFARKNTESCEDYTEVLLCHAKLYVLGDMYIIPALKQLALHRLHATLKTFRLYPRRVQDVVTLARYLFENTVPEDKVRDMIVLYFACVVEDLVEHEGLQELIEEVPGFAVGLFKGMSERLV